MHSTPQKTTRPTAQAITLSRGRFVLLAGAFMALGLMLGWFGHGVVSGRPASPAAARADAGRPPGHAAV